MTLPKRYFSQKKEQIPFTKEGYDDLLVQQKKLLSERPEAVEHLRKAREMGDLSENGYYKASRARLTFLDAQLRRLERLVKLGVVVESASTGSVDIGSTVTVSDGTKTFEYKIVGGYESDPAKQTISFKSPIGAALIGKKAGDTVIIQVPAGIKTYTLQNII